MPEVLSSARVRDLVWCSLVCLLVLFGFSVHAADRTKSESTSLSEIEEIPWPSREAKTSLPKESKEPIKESKEPIDGKIDVEKTSAAIVIPASSVSHRETDKDATSRVQFRRPLRSIKASIETPPGGDLPKMDHVGDDLELGIVDPFSNGQCRPWAYSSYQWEAPATRHLPLLFEEPNLERLGYTYGFCNVGLCDEPPRGGERIQPILSMAHFIGRIPVIPYMAGVHPLTEPVYTLGVDRPGSPVPYRKYLPHCSLRGAIYQAGFMVGTAFIIP